MSPEVSKKVKWGKRAVGVLALLEVFGGPTLMIVAAHTYQVGSNIAYDVGIASTPASYNSESSSEVSYVSNVVHEHNIDALWYLGVGVVTISAGIANFSLLNDLERQRQINTGSGG